MIPHAYMRSCLLCIYKYIYDSKSYICHFPLIYKVPQWYLKCIRLVIGNTLYMPIYLCMSPNYMYIPFSLQYTCV